MVEFTHTNISEKALDVLRNMSDIEEGVIQMNSGTLDAKVYKTVKSVMSSIGGTWKGGNTQGFVFKYDPTSALSEVLNMGKMPKENPAAFFPAPANVIQHMLSTTAIEDWNANEPEFRILEPSAGVGAIAKEIRALAPNATLDTVEFLDINQEILKAEGFDPICGDFMEYNTDAAIKYDVIYMNPPFSVKGDKLAYITHINHAKSMLKEGGKVWAIVPCGFMSNRSKKERAFYDDVMDEGAFYDLPKGTFKEAGTMVDTMVISVSNDAWKKNPYKRYGEGYEYASYHVWEFAFNIINDNDLSIKHTSLINKMIKKGEFDAKKYETFIEDAVESFKKGGIGFPYREIPNYVVYGEHLFRLEMNEVNMGTDEVMIPSIHTTQPAQLRQGTFTF